jgi:hypothetical protein
MLKGHVFSKQIFGNPIFALFINTFLNGENGVSNNYKNGMKPTYSGSTVNIDSGAVCVQGRFLEEDTSTSVQAGTNSAYCKLVVEIDLDKQNTESEFNQASYKIITSSSSYPALTQTNIVKNNSGIYQYELARFKTSENGITDFKDMRTYLDFDSIFDEIRTNYNAVLEELQQSLADVKDGSDYLLKSIGGTVEGEIKANGGLSGELIPKMLLNENLNNLKATGFYYAYGGNTVSNKPTGINNFSLLVTKTGSDAYSQIIIDDKGNIYSRTSNGGNWYNWKKCLNKENSYSVIEGTMILNAGENTVDTYVAYPKGFNVNNSIIVGLQIGYNGRQRWASGSNFDSSALVQGANPTKVILRENEIQISLRQILLNDDKVILFESNEAITIYYKLTLLRID